VVSVGGALTVSVNPTGLAAGVYVYFLTVSAPNMGNAPQVFVVRLTIS
jgi:hypothetical protein